MIIKLLLFLCFSGTTFQFTHSLSEVEKPSCPPGVTVTRALSRIDQDRILKAQNLLRSKIQQGRFGDFPRPSLLLRQLTWDQTLAELSWRWIQHCPTPDLSHPPDAAVEFSPDKVAMNIFWSQSKNAEPEAAVFSWIKSSRNFPGLLTYEADGLGHSNRDFIQLIFSGTDRVGCASGILQGFPFSRIFVCSYAGSRVLERGAAAYEAMEPFLSVDPILGASGEAIQEEEADVSFCSKGESKVQPNKLDAGWQIQIVKVHNYLRSQMAAGNVEGFPKAADDENMKLLSWNESLAAAAEKLIHLCPKPPKSATKDQDKQLRSLFKTNRTNYNIFWSEKTVISPMEPILAWFQEQKDFKGILHDELDSQGRKNNHFVQIVWGNTNAIGCSMASLPTADIAMFVCFYSPPAQLGVDAYEGDDQRYVTKGADLEALESQAKVVRYVKKARDGGVTIPAESAEEHEKWDKMERIPKTPYGTNCSWVREAIMREMKERQDDSVMPTTAMDYHKRQWKGCAVVTMKSRSQVGFKAGNLQRVPGGLPLLTNCSWITRRMAKIENSDEDESEANPCVVVLENYGTRRPMIEDSSSSKTEELLHGEILNPLAEKSIDQEKEDSVSLSSQVHPTTNGNDGSTSSLEMDSEASSKGFSEPEKGKTGTTAEDMTSSTDEPVTLSSIADTESILWSTEQPRRRATKNITTKTTFQSTTLGKREAKSTGPQRSIDNDLVDETTEEITGTSGFETSISASREGSRRAKKNHSGIKTTGTTDATMTTEADIDSSGGSIKESKFITVPTAYIKQCPAIHVRSCRDEKTRGIKMDVSRKFSKSDYAKLRKGSIILNTGIDTSKSKTQLVVCIVDMVDTGSFAMEHLPYKAWSFKFKKTIEELERAQYRRKN